MKYCLPILFLILSSISSIGQNDTSNVEMINRLSEIYKVNLKKGNYYNPTTYINHFDSVRRSSKDTGTINFATFNLASSYMNIGREQEAVNLLEGLVKEIKPYVTQQVYLNTVKKLALAYMRLGERVNCVNDHSSESCIMPIKGNGVHDYPLGSRNAIKYFTEVLSVWPNDDYSIWVMNMAYMTLGEYPDSVPNKWLIPGLDKNDSIYSVKPFVDVAGKIGFNYHNCAGGLVVEDMNNDGYLDIITSSWNLSQPMHFLLNDTKGGFKDLSKHSNLGLFTGGLNMVHADYNNDGYNDIFVLRGAWMAKNGRKPNSLLRNNGDNTFTDVTKESGLYSEYPTQTAVWSDFNNDGWLDLFIGNESNTNEHPSQLYISNRDGTFSNKTDEAGVRLYGFVKGVNAGDINNDGWQDIIISSFNGRILLENTGIDSNNVPHFKDLSVSSGISKDNMLRTFTTWMWDYNNDGWEDILVTGYHYDDFYTGSAVQMAREALGKEKNSNPILLYKNNGNGTFTNESESARLSQPVFAMGGNFGDIDNDGFLDMYFGTGDPDFGSLQPSILFRNMTNGTFADVTVSARVGNLQKGHGVAIVDIDNDGDGDLMEEMGGAFLGDAFMNTLYLNPGQNNNNFISILLVGTESNKSAIGSRVKVTFTEGDTLRSVYRTVNTGGSFGSSALRREIGIGSATKIEEIEIQWAGTMEKQVFKNIKANQFIVITQGNKKFEIQHLNVTSFKNKSEMHMHHH